MLNDEEMITILEEIARSGKSHGARIDAIKELRRIREANAEPVEKPEANAGDGFDGLYAVENPGRTRKAS